VHNLFYYIHTAIFVTTAYYSPSNIMSTHPRRVLYAFSFNFIAVTHRMQYTHVTMEKFNPFRRTVLISWGLLLAQLYFSLVYKESLMDEPTLYLIIDLISFITMVHLIYYVIDELKEILNINAFIITRPLRLIKSSKKDN
jgi:hypothetical protein